MVKKTTQRFERSPMIKPASGWDGCMFDNCTHKSPSTLSAGISIMHLIARIQLPPLPVNPGETSPKAFLLYFFYPIQFHPYTHCCPQTNSRFRTQQRSSRKSIAPAVGLVMIFKNYIQHDLISCTSRSKRNISESGS